jgi:hypothetical protein
MYVNKTLERRLFDIILYTRKKQHERRTKMAEQTVAEPQVYRVSMRLTPRDVENTNLLEQSLAARSKADAISQALGIARVIVEAIQKGDQVLVRRPGSELVERLVVPNVTVSSSAKVNRAA